MPIPVEPTPSGVQTRGRRDFVDRRIEDLEAVKQYIESMDLSPLRRTVLSGRAHLGWSAEQYDHVERLYRNMLILWRCHEEVSLPPSEEVDELWHLHILDTHRYFDDCGRIFGYYRHHFPYFGTRGADDARALDSAWDLTQELHRRAFGDYIYEYEPPAAIQLVADRSGETAIGCAPERSG